VALFNTATTDEPRRYVEGHFTKRTAQLAIHEWVFMDGSMTVTLNFAEGTLSVKYTPTL
jgi:chorismate-pyruvate lyase